MVKREKSPEPIDDSKYLAVVHPFPLNANMELPGDFTQFMWWIACITGKDYVCGVHHKPSARGMVLLEISKSYPHFDRLLGEHKWSEFLRNPTPEERPRKTRIYYSTYSSARAAQKDGWKYIYADDGVFKKWSLVNVKIQNPYPSTHWCDLPPEDPTNKAMCRPLPVAVKAPPPAPAVLVPGSTTWTSQKTGMPTPSENARSQDQKSKPSKGNTSTSTKAKSSSAINANAWRTPIINTPSSSGNKSASSTPTSARAKSAVVPSNIRTTTTSVDATSISTPPPMPAPAVPPGLPPPGLPSRPANPAGSSSVSQLQVQFAKMHLPPTDDIIIDDSDEEGNELDDFPNIASVIPRTSDLSNKTPSTHPAAEEYGVDLWSDPKTSLGRPTKPVEKELCPFHGILCTKGICDIMRKREIKEKIKQEKEEKRASRKRRGAETIQEKEEGVNNELSGQGGLNDENTGSIAHHTHEASAKSKVEDRSSEPSSSKRSKRTKRKAKQSKLWSDMVEENAEDDDDLGSIMSFPTTK